jgi:hypothetical protein
MKNQHNQTPQSHINLSELILKIGYDKIRRKSGSASRSSSAQSG